MAKRLLSDARRAEAERLNPAEVAERVDFIAELMSGMEYVPGDTDRELAAIWGLADSSVRNSTAEASRRMRACFTTENADLLRSQLLGKMLEVGAAAASRTKQVVDRKGDVHTVSDPDIRTALQALVEVAALMGLTLERHEHRFRPVQEYSEAELLDALRDTLSQHPAIIKNLESAGWKVTVPDVPPKAPALQ